MMSTFFSLMMCVRRFLPAERSVTFIATVMLIGNIIFGLVLGMSLSWLVANDPQTDVSATRPMPGVVVSDKLMDLFESRQKTTQRQGFYLSGTYVYISSSDPMKQQQGIDLVQYASGQVANRPEDADISMTWNPEKDRWDIASTDAQKPELALMGWFVLRRVAPMFHYEQGLSRFSDPLATTVVVGEKPVQGETRVKFIRSLVYNLVYFCILSPSLLLMGLAAYSLSFDVEGDRNSGGMEVFAMSQKPIWFLLLARSVSRSLIVVIASTLMLLVGSLFAGLASVWVLLGFIVAIWITSIAANLLATLQVMWWHHKWSRTIGFFFFNPLYIMFGIMFLFRHALPLDPKEMVEMGDNALPISGGLLFAGWETPAMLLFFVLYVPLMLGIIAMICAILEWRVGIRRQNLGKLV